MKKYLINAVTWEVEVMAESPEEALKEWLEMGNVDIEEDEEYEEKQA